jgi:streptogramin lyase
MSEIIQGNKVQVGDIDNSVVAIGDGSRIIIQKMRSVVEIEQERIQSERSTLKQHLERHVEALSSKAKSGQTTIADSGMRQPYKSLSPYTIADAGRFFGRHKATQALLRTVGSTTLTVVHGESGAGKSSLLQASLVPHLLANAYLPFYLTIRNRTLCDTLKNALLPEIDMLPILRGMQLRSFLHELQRTVGNNTLIVIIYDQFEVFFSNAFSAESRRADFEELRECVEDATLNLRVVLSIRDDMFAKLAELESNTVKPYENHFTLPFFTLEEARQIIIEPAKSVGISYQEGLVDTILNDFNSVFIPPSQLQIIFNTLVERLPDDLSEITESIYESAGRVSGILTNYLQEIKSQLPSKNRQIVQAILESLISTDQRREAKTPSELQEDISAFGFDVGLLDTTLDYLLAKRVISPVQIGELADAYAFEIVHDYIAEQVEITPEVQAKKIATELINRRLIDYQRFGSLLTADELRVVQTQITRLKLSDEARRLIQISTRAKLRRRSVQVAVIFLVLGLVFAATIIYLTGQFTLAEERINAANTAVFIRQQANNDIATATYALNELAILQETQIANLATLDVRLDAAEDSRAIAERQSYLSSVVSSRLSRVYSLGVQSDPTAALVVNMNELWIAHELSRNITIVDLSSGQVVLNLQMTEQPNSLIFVNDLVWVSANTLLVVIDPSNHRVIDEITIPGRAGDLAYDGLHIWISNEDGVTKWDPRTMEIVEHIPLPLGAYKLEFGAPNLWLSSYTDNLLSILDVQTSTILSEFTLQHPVKEIYFDGETVWVTNGTGVLTGFNAVSLQQTNEYELGGSLSGITFDGRTLWVADTSTNTIVNLNYTTGEILGRYRTGRGVETLEFDNQYIWSLNRVDATLTRIPLQFPLQISPVSVAYGFGHLWVIDQRSTQVIGINELTGEVDRVYDLDAVLESIVITPSGEFWLSLMDTNAIIRIDPSTGQVLDTFLVSNGNGNFYIGRDTLLVSFADEQGLLAINRENRTLRTTYEIAGEIVAIAESDSTIWVVTREPNEIVVINTDEIHAATYDLPNTPLSLTVDESENIVWVGTIPNNQIIGIEANDIENQVTFNITHEPRVVLARNGILWVAGGDYVSRIDSNSSIPPILYSVGRNVLDASLSPNGLWVSSYTDRTVEYIVIE